MADQLGIDRSTYSYYELGKITPDIPTIMHLSEIFGVHYTKILEFEDVNRFLDSQSNKEGYNYISESISEKKISMHISNNLTKEEQDILIAFRLLSYDSQKAALEFISQKFKNDKSKNKN